MLLNIIWCYLKDPKKMLIISGLSIVNDLVDINGQQITLNNFNFDINYIGLCYYWVVQYWINDRD